MNPHFVHNLLCKLSFNFAKILSVNTEKLFEIGFHRV